MPEHTSFIHPDDRIIAEHRITSFFFALWLWTAQFTSLKAICLLIVVNTILRRKSMASARRKKFAKEISETEILTPHFSSISVAKHIKTYRSYLKNPYIP